MPGGTERRDDPRKRPNIPTIMAPGKEISTWASRQGLAPFAPDSTPLSRWEHTTRFLVDEIDGIVMLASASIIVLGKFFGQVQGLEESAVAALAVAAAFRILRLKYQLVDVLRTLMKRADGTDEHVESLYELLQSDRLHEVETCDRPQFYRHMLAALRHSSRCVDLTQLDEQPPRHYGTREMVEYFELQTQMVRECPHIVFRRIVSIPTFEKLQWLLDILEQISDCANFQINLIDISRSAGLPPPLSLQIFDREQLCLVDPTVGYMLPSEQRDMLWIRGKAACEVFSVYYDNAWALSRRIKEGSIIYWNVLEEVANELSMKFPEKRTLSIAILGRLAVLSGTQKIK
jgi:hypothetical protein